MTNGDYGAAEHEVIMETIKQGVTYDQYDITNSAPFEVLLRRAQASELADSERVREVGGNKGSGKGDGILTFEEHEAFTSTMKTGVSMICPTLLDQVKEDVGTQGDLMKSLIKAREFREQLNEINMRASERALPPSAPPGRPRDVFPLPWPPQVSSAAPAPNSVSLKSRCRAMRHEHEKNSVRD